MARASIPDIQFQENDSEAVRLQKLRRLMQALQELARSVTSVAPAPPPSGGITMTGPAVLGRLTGTGSPLSLTGAQVTSMLELFSSASKGLVPSPGTATGNRFLRDDGAWTTVTFGGAFEAPTAEVGLVAIPGVATRGIRSDGAPALSQAIEPVWTGQHEFVLTPIVPDQSWTYAKIQDATALSVLGRAFDTDGVLDEIVAGSDLDVLQRRGNQISFGPLDVTRFPIPQDGEDGEDGLFIKGTDGVDGRDGYTIRGDDGEDGDRGPPGVQGEQGIQGPPGPSGSGGDATMVVLRGEDGEDGRDGFMSGIGTISGSSSGYPEELGYAGMF